MPIRIVKPVPNYVILLDTGEGSFALAGEADTAKDVLTLANEVCATVTPESVFIYQLSGIMAQRD